MNLMGASEIHVGILTVRNSDKILASKTNFNTEQEQLF